MGKNSIELTSRYGMRTEEFSALMKHRVLEILLVASHYDSFVLEEDGQLTELVIEEYRNLDLNLRYAPRFTRASEAAEALRLIEEREFDMVVTTPRLPDMEIGDLVHLIKKDHPELPVGLLAAHAWELPWLEDLATGGNLDWTFLWQGNVQSLLAMIKQVEDRRNAEHDILVGGVQAIILVEDEVASIRSTSPTSTPRSPPRPAGSCRKASTSPTACCASARDRRSSSPRPTKRRGSSTSVPRAIFSASSPTSASRRGGKLDHEAGIELAEASPGARRRSADPHPVHGDGAPGEGDRNRCPLPEQELPHLLEELRGYIVDNFGFGDFIFKLPDGSPIARASDMRSMLERWPRCRASRWSTTPAAITSRPGSRRAPSSSWPRCFGRARSTEFDSPSELREYLIKTITGYLREIQRHVITDFEVEHFNEFAAFSKIGSGSLGGKGRGLAFMHKILARERLDTERRRDRDPPDRRPSSAMSSRSSSKTTICAALSTTPMP